MLGTRRTAASLAALASLGPLLAGCGGGGPSPSDARFIDGFSEFSAPVKLSLPLDSSGLAGGGLPMYGVARPCILSRLADTGVIAISPSIQGPPWWKAKSATATIAGNTIDVPVGSREVTAKADERKWSADGKDYYAATYSYVIHTPKGFAGPAPRTLGPFKVRATFIDDPAVGRWAPFDQTPAPPAPAPATEAENGAAPPAPDAQTAAPAAPQPSLEPSLLPQAPDASGAAPAPPAPPAPPPQPVAGVPIDPAAELTALMNQAFPEHACTVTIEAHTGPARAAAFAAIEGQLAQKGVLAKGPDPGVLTSRASGLTWWAGLVNLAGRTLADVPGACASLAAKGAGPWRAPSAAEMKTLIATDQNLAQWPGAPFDAPDHRFFGAVITTHPDETLRFYTSNSRPAPNGVTNFDTFEYSGFNGQFLERPIAGQSAGTVRLGSFDRVLCVSGQGSPPPAAA